MTSRFDLSGLGDVAVTLRRLAIAPNPGTRRAHIAEAAAAARASSPATQSSPMAAALGRAAVVVLGLTITASALAAQAMLPLPLQELASRVAGSVGFDIPSDPVAGTSSRCGDDTSDRREGPISECAPSTKQSAVPIDPSAGPDEAPGSGDGSEDDLDAPEENQDGVTPEGEDSEEPVERGAPLGDDNGDEDQAADEDDEDDGDDEADEDDGEDEEDGPEHDDDGDEEDGDETGARTTDR